MKRDAWDLELKLAENFAETGAVEGYGSVYNVIDRGGDIVLPGAFKASIADWKRRKAMPPMLWQHYSSEPIGVWSELAEDSRGLKVVGQLVLEVPLAASARALMQAGAIKGLSIGYETREFTVDRKSGVRSIKRADLWEISLVTFPMNADAQITGVKDIDPRELERLLRSELNLSSALAVKAVAIVKQHLRDGGDQPEHDPRDGAKDMLMSLRRAAALLRD
jgi:HK97 family phage prohead protease